MESYTPESMPREEKASAPKICYCTHCGTAACGSFCTSCGAPLRFEQPVYSAVPQPPMTAPAAAPMPKRKKNVGVIVLCILTGISVLLMLATMAIHFVLSNLPKIDLPDPIKTEVYRGGVSSAEYDRLELGMTYAHISSIIGGDGTPIESGTTVQGDTYYIYGWPGEHGDTAAVYITFTNDVSTEITVDGVL